MTHVLNPPAACRNVKLNYKHLLLQKNNLVCLPYLCFSVTIACIVSIWLTDNDCFLEVKTEHCDK